MINQDMQLTRPSSASMYCTWQKIGLWLKMRLLTACKLHSGVLVENYSGLLEWHCACSPTCFHIHTYTHCMQYTFTILTPSPRHTTRTHTHTKTLTATVCWSTCAYSSCYCKQTTSCVRLLFVMKPPAAAFVHALVIGAINNTHTHTWKLASVVGAIVHY